VNVLGLEEFSAKRRARQSAIEEDLRPVVKEALSVEQDTSGWNELLALVSALYQEVYSEESGETGRRPDTRWINRLRETLRKTKPPRDTATVDRISIFLATAILSEATAQAALDDPEELFLEWVSMEDEAVRPSHRTVHGQQRPIGEKFDVGGSEMTKPGDVSAPIEEWINCRCTVRPVLASEVLAAAGAVVQTSAASEGADMDPKDMIEQVDGEVDAPMGDVALQWYSVFAPEGVWSGDRRRFAEGSLRTRPLPLPLTWQKQSADGHDGNITVAKTEQIMRVGNEIRATGPFLMTPEADEVAALIAEFGRFGISVDADDSSFEFDEEEEGVTFDSGRICSACIVPIPAFHQAYIMVGTPPEDFFEGGTELTVEREEGLAAANTFVDVAPGRTEDGPGWLTHPVDTDRLRDYWTKGEGAAKISWGTSGDFNRCRTLLAEYVKPQYLSGYCANRHYDALGFWPGEHRAEDSVVSFDTERVEVYTGEAINFAVADVPKAPAEWFVDPEFDDLTHVTVTEEGRVFGHIAGWKTCHGMFLDQCVLPPHSSTEYAHFLTGQTLTDDGLIRTGVLTVGGPHAPKRARLRPAQAHYEETSAAVADVNVGEDAHGIWCAGWVRPGATPEQIIALRASDISGDWRHAPGAFDRELIAALAVNVGGFNVPRVAAAVHNGEAITLIGAGMVKHSEKASKGFAEKFDLDALAEVIAEALEDRENRKRRLAALADKVKVD
jgi:hypothetical protein